MSPETGSRFYAPLQASWDWRSDNVTDLGGGKRRSRAVALIETLTASVGGAVARSVLQIWLKDSAIAREVSLTMDQLVGRRVKNMLERRRLVREFERVAEEVAEKLQPYFEAEYRGLDDNEKKAAALTVEETIRATHLTDDLLFAVDLDPLQLEKYFRAAKPTAAADALLAPPAADLYDFTLREAANYIVDVVLRLPEFGSRAARELLRRETDTADLVREVLKRIPDQSIGGAVGDPAGFEAEYNRSVARKLDRLELFGLRTSELSGRYALSVAYLSLTASMTSDRHQPSHDSKGKHEPAGEDLFDSDERRYVRVEEALSSSKRSLIRGEAGSGKTTLLQWLAVSSARQGFEDSLRAWNDTVPFFIPLRQYVGGELPPTEAFVNNINPHLRDAMPSGWITDQLTSGRAIVLVDGVDELPETERTKARTWLLDLIAVYPEASYVVTSRPPAIGEDWLAAEGFEACVLEPMDMSDIDAFIDHWHRAVLGVYPDQDEAADLERLKVRLKAVVRETPPVRALATSPLLCAMLCALNRDRRAQLPADRVELYRIGLEMLLERRDIEREVRSDSFSLGLREKGVLLRDFAFWLLVNGQSDAARQQAIDMMESKLDSMPRVTAPAYEVFNHLLLRSGLLREPIAGRIDFVHRTFQEYLGAEEAVERSHIGLLAGRGHLDQWREVVILAAGLAAREQRETLIRLLLQRGEQEPEYRHRLHLLAVACLETSPELSSEMTTELSTILGQLIPPANMTEARALASAGDLAAPLLGEHQGQRAPVAAACVRALGLIGTESALRHLRPFAEDPRVTVARELIRAWDGFPIEEYAAQVLGASPLNYGYITLDSPEKLAAARNLRKLKAATCSGERYAGPDESWDWSALTSSDVESVTLSRLRNLTALPDLHDAPKLRELEVVSCPNLVALGTRLPPFLTRITLTSLPLEDVGDLGGFEELDHLMLHRLSRLSHLPSLGTGLQRVSLANLPVPDLSSLRPCTGLRSFFMFGCERVTDLSPLADKPHLGYLAVMRAVGVAEIDLMKGLPAVENLVLSGCKELSDAAPLGDFQTLTQLELSECPSVTDIAWIPKLANLLALDLSGCSALEDLSPTSELTGLLLLDLSECTGIQDLSPVAELRALEHLTLVGCTGVRDLSPLAHLKGLRYLDLERCTGVDDLTPLAELPGLLTLDIRGCAPELDLSPLDRNPPGRTFMGQALGLRAGFSILTEAP